MSSPFTRADILRVSLPLLASYLLEQIIGMTDAAFLGRVGEVELGASAIGGIAFLAFLTLVLGYGYAAQASMGHAIGERRLGDVGAVFGSATLLMQSLGFAILLVIVFFCDDIFALLCEDPAVAHAATDYVVWRSLGLPVAFAVGLLRAFYVATFNTRMITLSAIAMALSNGLFNYALIFGVGPIPAMGIKGAALASALSEGVAFLVLFGFLFRAQQHKTYELFSHFTFAPKLIRKLVNMGIWVSLRDVAAFGTWMLFFVAVEHISPLALASSNVVRQFSSLFLMFLHAFGAATGSLGANLIGQGKPEAVKAVSLEGLKLTIAFALPVAVVLLVANVDSLRIFTDLPDVLNHSMGPLLVMVAGYLFGVPGMFYIYVFSGIGANRASGIVIWVASFLYVVYTQGIAWLTMSTTWVWTADAFFYGLVCAGVLYFMRHDAWLNEAMSRRNTANQ